MALIIKWNDDDFQAGIKRLTEAAKQQNLIALTELAMEILRLSSFQVPHDTGMLQASGAVAQELGEADVVLVGYNKVYAARLHEHPEYRFQKGRKGKYLEDPIKENLNTFRQYYKESMSKIIK